MSNSGESQIEELGGQEPIVASKGTQPTSESSTPYLLGQYEGQHGSIMGEYSHSVSEHIVNSEDEHLEPPVSDDQKLSSGRRVAIVSPRVVSRNPARNYVIQRAVSSNSRSMGNGANNYTENPPRDTSISVETPSAELPERAQHSVARSHVFFQAIQYAQDQLANVQYNMNARPSLPPSSPAPGEASDAARLLTNMSRVVDMLRFVTSRPTNEALARLYVSRDEVTATLLEAMDRVRSAGMTPANSSTAMPAAQQLPTGTMMSYQSQQPYAAYVVSPYVLPLNYTAYMPSPISNGLQNSVNTGQFSSTWGMDYMRLIPTVPPGANAFLYHPGYSYRCPVAPMLGAHYYDRGAMPMAQSSVVLPGSAMSNIAQNTNRFGPGMSASPINNSWGGTNLQAYVPTNAGDGWINGWGWGWGWGV